MPKDAAAAAAAAAEIEKNFPWGSLPVEQWLIRNWDWDSTDSAEQQRRSLISSFMKTSLFDWTCAETSFSNITQVPTDEEIRIILKPWRPMWIRETAEECISRYAEDIVVLRTHYVKTNDGARTRRWVHDRKMRYWLDQYQKLTYNHDGDEGEWLFLDDPALFDFGNDWKQVFHFLPELTGRPNRQYFFRDLCDEDIDSALLLENSINWLHWRIFSDVSVIPFAIADEEAFDTNMVRIVFLDGYGNEVRSTRIRATELAHLKSMTTRFALLDSFVWEKATVNPEYEADGNIGYALLHGERPGPRPRPPSL